MKFEGCGVCTEVGKKVAIDSSATFCCIEVPSLLVGKAKKIRKQAKILECSVVDGRGVALRRPLVLVGVFAGSALVDGAVSHNQFPLNSAFSSIGANLRNALLRPLKIALHFLRGLHTVGKVPLCRRQPLARKGLQLHQFARLGVELS